MKAYWFSKNGLTQQGSTCYEVRPEPYHQNGRIEPCENGLHASEHPLEALCFAQGSNLTLDRVELGGTIVAHGDPPDKYAASERTHLKRIPADPILKEFARWCALQVTHLWDCPPEVKQYLETGDESLRDAVFAAIGHARIQAGRATDKPFANIEEARACWAAHAAILAASHATQQTAGWSTKYITWSAVTDAEQAIALISTAAVIQDAKAAQRDHFKTLVDAAFEQAP